MESRESYYKTIKPRQFTVTLSNNDMRMFYDLAHSNGTTPTEILTGFICDLVGGTQTRGSDERDLANQYFDRCGYAYMADMTLLTWALKENLADTIIDLHSTMQSAAEDIAYFKEHSDEDEHDFVQEQENALDNARKDLDDIYAQYKQSATINHCDPQSLQEGMDAVLEYQKELDALDIRF